MDPLSIIVTALAAGAAAGLHQQASQVVKDAYDGLKGLIKRKYSTVNVEQLEQGPEVPQRREFAKFELSSTEAPNDEEVLREAQRLLDAVKNEAPGVAQTVGVSMEDIEAASIRLKGIIASGAGSIGVSMSGVHATGDIDIQDVHVGAAATATQKSRGGSKRTSCCLPGSGTRPRHLHRQHLHRWRA